MCKMFYKIKVVYISDISILYCVVDAVDLILMDKTKSSQFRGKIKNSQMFGQICEFCKFRYGRKKCTALFISAK